MEPNQDIRTTTATVESNFADLFKSLDNPELVEQPIIEAPIVTEEAPIVTEQATEVIEQLKEELQIAPLVTEHKKKLNSLIEDGILENVAINVTGEDGETKEVFLSDLDKVDGDMYSAIIANYKKAKDDEIKEKYISREGIDETTEKLIAIRKAGGDITELIQNNISAIDQLQNIKSNLADDEQLQINVVAQDLRNKGLSDNVVNAQIKDYIDNLQLDAEAEKIVDAHLGAHKQEIENKKQSELARVEEEKEAQKQTRKTLSSTYKEWQLPEALQKVLVDNATKTDNSGLTNTDKLYFETVKDPQKYAELVFFLNNPEEFKKSVSSKKVFQAKTENLTTMFTLNLKSTKKPSAPLDTLEDRYADAIQKK